MPAFAKASTGGKMKMRKIISIALVLAGAFLFALVFPEGLRAQNFIAITGTVVDPNGIPYGNGTMSAVLTPGSPGGWTLGGNPYSGRVGPVTLDSTGSFTANFGSNAAILPAGTKWQITVNSNQGGIAPPLGTGAQTFSVTMTLNTSQNISTTLNAAAPKLTTLTIGSGTVTGTGVSPQVAFWTSPTTISGDSHMIWDNTHHWLSLNDPAAPGICCGSAVIVNLPTPGTGAFTATIPATAAGGTSGFFGISQATVGNAGNILPVAIGQGTPPTYSDLTTTAGFEADGSLFMEPILNTPNPILQIIHAVGVTTRDYFGIFNDPSQSETSKFFKINFANQAIYKQATTGTPVGNLNVMGSALSAFADTEAPMLFLEPESNSAGGNFTVPACVKDKAAPASSYMCWSAFDAGSFNFLMTDDQVTYDALQFNTNGNHALEYMGGLIIADNGFQGTTYATATNCTSAASPAVCGSAVAGTVVIAAGATTKVVNTTAVTANSEIFIQFDSSLGTKLSVTCNATVDLGQVTARVPATSFTITSAAAPAVNPACYSYHIIN